MGEKRNVYRLLVGKPPLGIPKCKWVDNIKMDLVDRMGWCGLDWSGSGQGQVESSCEHGNEFSGSVKCWKTTELLHNKHCFPMSYVDHDGLFLGLPLNCS
jgi:hypothetical protein